jgi:hypothetical protein
MKRYNTIGWRSARTAILIIMAVLFTPVHCQVLHVTLTLQQNSAQSGRIIPDPGVHDFALNSEVNLTAIPKPGYRFVRWMGDVADSTSSTTIVFLDKPKVVIAVFEQNEYDTSSMEANTSGGAGGGSVAIVYRSPQMYNPPGEYCFGLPLELWWIRWELWWIPWDLWWIPREPCVPPYRPVPEAATALLLALGGSALLMRRRSA